MPRGAPAIRGFAPRRARYNRSMHRSSPRGSPLPSFRLIGGALLFWGAFALISAIVLYYHLPLVGRPSVPLPALLVYTAIENAYWALVTLPVLLVVRRLPPFGRHALRHVAALCVVGVAVHAGAAWTMHVCSSLRHGPQSTLLARFLNSAAYDLALYAGIVAAGAAHLGWTTARAREREALTLRAELARAELEVLRMQLQPHFLFNALNSISELVHLDPERADRAVARLGDLLRLSLRHSGRSEVSVAEELEFLAHYVDLQQLRVSAGIHFAIDAAADTHGLAIPSLILQPLVENALRHGVRGRERGRIDVRLRRDGARLAITVEDDGAGAPPDPPEGMGLTNARTRLAALYGDGQSIRCANRAGGGYSVELSLPARPAPATA